ncbi:MAG: two-component system, chemotaxis family, sensor histidine kinase and response regulator WspE [Actinomycetota bacterium]|jgi:chemotaxis protein histidine kinase CheA|nr:two-component system, chemotaxis family, sensor histidine kinase and response regulator WspE [Actinomycetota bacterium]
MGSWAEDPELLATFRAEVDERLASLSAGLLQLESHAAPKQLMAGLFRDAHTVKGSARMMGLHKVLETAHAAEDLLGALRDGRFQVRRDYVDLLLATADGIGRSIVANPPAVVEEYLAALVTALRDALGGGEPVVVPRMAEPVPVPLPPPPPAAAPFASAGPIAAPAWPVAPPLAAVSGLGSLPAAPAAAMTLDRGGERAVDSVRVTSQRVYDLLDVVGEAELDARRVEQNAEKVVMFATEQKRWLRTLRDAVAANGSSLPEDVELAVHQVVSVTDQMQASGQQLRELVEDARGRLALVRDGAMGLAMVPVRRVVAAFPRLIRDVASSTHKDVRLNLVGEDVELDKKVLDGVADALKHLVINAVDHGCETPEDRLAAGKPPRATVTVLAKAAGGTVVLEVSDDGRGIDEDKVRAAAIDRGLLPAGSTLAGAQLFQLLFLAAFSTSATVTSTSGRGVGLDVVKTAVDDLGGTIDVFSELGAGTRFVLTLPITLGVLRCLIARVGDERYAVPVPGVMESLSLRDVAIGHVAGVPVVIRHGVSVPLLDLGSALGVESDRDPRAALVVRHNGASDLIAWSVDRLEGELELVVKDLGSFVGRLPLVTGATIDGDGSVVCLIDLRELSGRAGGTGHNVNAHLGGQGGAVDSANGGNPEPSPLGRKPRVLVVEDSVGVRELERAILESAGYEVVTAVDGLDGIARLRAEPADLVLSDVEMPGMDGFTLTRTIRRTRGWEQVPVVIMTSRGDESDRRAGLEAGASAYLLKSDFDQTELVDTVRRLLGR